MNEKAISSSDASSEDKLRSPRAGPSVRPQHQSFSRGPSHISTQPTILPIQRLPCQSQSYIRPRGLRITNLIRPWLPIILYALTSLIFLIAIAFYKAELFSALDELSRWLQADKTYGQAVLFFLIFLTTFPPVPLYSTLIILSGYTFGPWTGAVISYFAALSGALVVFLLSRTLLRETISRWLSSTCTLKRVQWLYEISERNVTRELLDKNVGITVSGNNLKVKAMNQSVELPRIKLKY
ncbi:Golgi apparatus membrane protein tvp38 [Lentinula edodes]|uniref:Golgi apparatus membrane protein TVP38 n=1 Tax=Lentinula edodes TaxID=5353 RepID=A0A1Q3E3S8_LENED|nr:Golgi apparatus membrane protein tvp38 [Lentinula edodes]